MLALSVALVLGLHTGDVRLDWSQSAAVLLGAGDQVRSRMNFANVLTWLSGRTYARDLTVLGWLPAPILVGPAARSGRVAGGSARLRRRPSAVLRAVLVWLLLRVSWSPARAGCRPVG